MNNSSSILEIVFIKTLKDNYTYFLREIITGTTVIIDPGEAKPCLDFLKKNNYNLNYILNTHHHYDHVDGNIELSKHTGAKIVGYIKDYDRIPGIDYTFDKIFKIGKLTATILPLDGHTIGHIGIYFPTENIIFCGDTLFSSGCGFVFEGTMQQMYNSLCTLKNLPDETLIYCGHEYTLANLKFALYLEPENEDIIKKIKKCKTLRKNNNPTLPSTIGIEKKTNPFFRTQVESIRQKLKLSNNVDEINTFIKIREEKNLFYKIKHPF